MAVKREAKKKEVARPSRAEMADLFDGIVEPPRGDALNDLKNNIEGALLLAAKIEQVEEMLASMKSEMNGKLTKFIPDAMRSVNMTEFTHESGMKVKLKDFLSGSLPKDPDKRRAALQWIHKNGGKDLIRNKFNIELERGDEKTRKGMIAALRKVEVDYVETVDVNHQSMQAWVRERMEEGLPTPLDVLGLYAGVTAKIEAPRVKKAKASPVAVSPASPGPRIATPPRDGTTGKPRAAPKPAAQPKGKGSTPKPKVKAPARRRESVVTASL